MLKLPEDTRIFMAVKPVDMRRSFDGLCATITEALGGSPLSGDLYLFRGKRADRIKAIIWDRNGLAIWYKRLKRGKECCIQHSCLMLSWRNVVNAAPT
jgi:transposase